MATARRIFCVRRPEREDDAASNDANLRAHGKEPKEGPLDAYRKDTRESLRDD